MTEKKNKSIGIDKDTRKSLTLQSIDLDKDYKLHCEDILERASKMSSEEVLAWLGTGQASPSESSSQGSGEKKPAPQKKVEKKTDAKKTKPEEKVEETPEKNAPETLEGEKNGSEDDKAAEISPTDKKHFDVSGVFKSVEPKIYTNKKCFEFRHFSRDNGVMKFYFGTLEEAQFAKNKPEEIE